MLSLLLRYKDELVSSEGGYWLMLIDGLLFVPLVMAAFFYPVPVLLGTAAFLVAVVVLYEAYVLWHRHQHGRHVRT